MNFGDGSQRLALQYRMRFNKLKAIFLTDLHWEEFGGIPGSAMTISEFRSNIAIVGPAGTGAMITAMKSFFIKFLFYFISFVRIIYHVYLMFTSSVWVLLSICVSCDICD